MKEKSNLIMSVFSKQHSISNSEKKVTFVEIIRLMSLMQRAEEVNDKRFYREKMVLISIIDFKLLNVCFEWH